VSTTKRLTKAFSDAIPLGPHPRPHSEWVSVRLDFVQEVIDHLEWLEKGNAEWRDIEGNVAALPDLSHTKSLLIASIQEIEQLRNERQFWLKSGFDIGKSDAK
jgi:hypothetical protein